MTSLITRAELFDSIQAESVVVIDALPASYYAQVHLPGAINLVEGDVDADAADRLPDRGAAIVTYCSNATCGNSEAVAQRLVALGYTNVRKYADGVQDWMGAGLPVEEGSPAAAT